MRDAYAQIEQIGLATGHAIQAAEVVTNMREQITDIVPQAGTKYQGLTYYWERSSGPVPVGNLGDARRAHHGHVRPAEHRRRREQARRQLAGAVGNYIVAARPQIIFLADNGRPSGQTPAMVAARPGWAGIPAVKDHEVIALNADIASQLGPAPAAVGRGDRQRARELQIVSEAPAAEAE